MKGSFEQGLLAQPITSNFVVSRSRFGVIWNDLPPVTALACAPGWGKTAWMTQCAQALGESQAAWIRCPIELGNAAANPEAIGAPVCLIDGIESVFSEDVGLWDHVFTLSEARKVVVSCHAVPKDVAPRATVLDERHLAFDADEQRQIIEHLMSAKTVTDMFLLPDTMRGCPWLVARDVARVYEGAGDRLRVTSELSSSALCYSGLREDSGFMTSEAGRALRAAGGLPTITETLLKALVPDVNVSHCFARMSHWPAFRKVVDDELGEEALEWCPEAWKMMCEMTSRAERMSALEAGLRAEMQRGSIVGQVRILLLLGRVDEAERIAARRLRLLILFASRDLLKLLAVAVRDFSAYPALALLFVELQTWCYGNQERTKAIALQAAKSISLRRPTGQLDEFARTSLVAFGAVSGGDRALAHRFVDHVFELIDGFGSAAEDLTGSDRAALSGQIYLLYWAAIQLDRHEDAEVLANLIVTIGNPSDRVMQMEQVCRANQMDLAGTTSLSGSQPPSADDTMSNTVSLRDLEDLSDDTAVGRLLPVINHPGVLPSRSAIDGLVLLVRGIADHRHLLASQVDASVERSRELWGDHPSSFVALGAMVCYVGLGSHERGRRLVQQLGPEDVFNSLARILWHQWMGEYEVAIDVGQVLLQRVTMPRFEVLALVLQAVSLHCQGSSGASQNALAAAWNAYRAPRLLRFAFRFVPATIAGEIITATQRDSTDRDFLECLKGLRDDPRPLIWSKRPMLTRSELEGLQMLRLGQSNQEIADRRMVVVGTIRNQLKSIYRKLGVDSRHEAVAAASRLGVLRWAKEEEK